MVENVHTSELSDMFREDSMRFAFVFLPRTAPGMFHETVVVIQ
jgi:hypothetical protein